MGRYHIRDAHLLGIDIWYLMSVEKILFFPVLLTLWCRSCTKHTSRKGEPVDNEDAGARSIFWSIVPSYFYFVWTKKVISFSKFADNSLKEVVGGWLTSFAGDGIQLSLMNSIDLNEQCWYTLAAYTQNIETFQQELLYMNWVILGIKVLRKQVYM